MFKKSKYIHDTSIHNFVAAKEIVPLIMALVQPRSVIDVGCGLATWLKIFADHQVQDILGVEGPHLKKEMLAVDESKVLIADLEKKLEINRRFDLVVSLEVAEHLNPTAAKQFVNTLTSLGDIVLFSAAIPRQGGQNHINEQWPTYWQSLFREHGFYFSDIIRKKIWDNPKVDVFYKQNMFLVCKNNLKSRFEETSTILNVVHPELFLKFRRKAFKPEVTYKP